MKNITVIGIGRLGLSFALLLERKGYSVLGVDINTPYVKKINNKILKSREPLVETYLQESTNFRATTNLQEGIEFSEIIFIIVQTPNSGGHKFYDHGIVSNILVSINKLQPTQKHFIIGCTVMPTYINEIATHLLDKCSDCSVSYNPEFIAQGDIIQGFLTPDIILIGTHSDYVKKELPAIYQQLVDNQPKICLMTPLEAEITKISINGYITTKLSYANMLSDLCDTLGANKNVVLQAIGSDTRIGTKYFKPGNSYGGPCFPRDTLALQLLLDQQSINSNLLQATHLYNQLHIDKQIDLLIAQELDTYVIRNVCYKENCTVPIIEESANLKIAKGLVNRGKTVIIEDIEELVLETKKEYGNIFTYRILPE